MTAKSEAEFYVHTKGSSRLRRECKQCVINKQIELKYGITIAEYKKLEKDQDGRCRICRRKSSKQRLAVDHCHGSGRVRGLLCSNCNTAIGLLHEDIGRIENAIRYLQGEDIV